MTTARTASRDRCCTPPTALDDDLAQTLSRIGKALGDPTRVRLLSLIARSAGGEACVCDLTAPVGLSQPTVTHHLQLLGRAGLVSREQRGRWAYFRLVPGALDAAQAALNQLVADSAEPAQRCDSQPAR